MQAEMVTGIVFYASEAAQRNRHYQEGRSIRTDLYVKLYKIADNFIQLDFDSTGRNYVHVSV